MLASLQSRGAVALATRRRLSLCIHSPCSANLSNLACRSNTSTRHLCSPTLFQLHTNKYTTVIPRTLSLNGSLGWTTTTTTKTTRPPSFALLDLRRRFAASARRKHKKKEHSHYGKQHHHKGQAMHAEIYSSRPKDQGNKHNNRRKGKKKKKDTSPPFDYTTHGPNGRPVLMQLTNESLPTELEELVLD